MPLFLFVEEIVVATANERAKNRRRKLGIGEAVKSIIVDGLKICTQCASSKPNDLEHFGSNGKKGLRPECRECGKKPKSKVKRYVYKPGDKFNSLTLVAFSRRNSRSTAYWICVCDCGVEKELQVGAVRTGNLKSCGCRRSSALSVAAKTHGLSNSSEWRIWASMRNRCYNKNNINYPYWGQRGIVVCDRWRDSFEAFLEDMGPRPTPKHSIDRIDNDGNYKPGNCRWATMSEQSLNRRGSRHRSFVLEVGDVSEEELVDWDTSETVIAALEVTFGIGNIPVGLVYLDKVGKTAAAFNSLK